jgi:hypothetical protein
LLKIQANLALYNRWNIYFWLPEAFYRPVALLDCSSPTDCQGIRFMVSLARRAIVPVFEKVELRGALS